MNTAMTPGERRGVILLILLLMLVSVMLWWRGARSGDIAADTRSAGADVTAKLDSVSAAVGVASDSVSVSGRRRKDVSGASAAERSASFPPRSPRDERVD